MERARKLGLYVDQTVAKLLYLISLKKLLPICNICILREKFKILAFQVLWVKYISAVKRITASHADVLSGSCPTSTKKSIFQAIIQNVFVYKYTRNKAENIFCCCTWLFANFVLNWYKVYKTTYWKLP